ncbi:MAG: hypothetical protein AAGD06_30550 [Acidobacteriota bacterium]
MRYGILFEVAIGHDYFTGYGTRVFEALGDDDQRAALRTFYPEKLLTVTPSKATRVTLAGLRALFKVTAEGFLVAVPLDPDAGLPRPKITPPPDLRLSFHLGVAGLNFLAVTALGAGFHHFTNASGNDTAGGRFLSRPVPAFDPDRAYAAGELRSAAAGPTVDLFQATRDTGPSVTPDPADWVRIPADTFEPASPYPEGAVVMAANRRLRAVSGLGPGSDPSDPAQWQEVGLSANQYATFADRMDLEAGTVPVDLTGAAVPTATVRLTAGGAPSPALEETFTAPSGNLGAVQVDGRGLRPGPYRLDVLDGTLAPIPGVGGDLYLDPEARRRGSFGVVDIEPGGGDLALLDGGGALRSPRYVLRFMNRSTRRRYVFPEPQAVGPGAEVTQEGGDGRILVTPEPRPLTRFGPGTLLQADDAGTPDISEAVHLPEPEAQRIRRQNAQWFSEIHMLNLPL